MTIGLEAVPVVVASFVGLMGTAFLAGMAIDRRSAVAMLSTTALCGLAIGMSQPRMQVDMTWLAASMALNAAVGLAHGAMGRLLIWAIGPVLLLAVVAASSALSSLPPVLVTVALFTTGLVGAWAGWSVRRLRQRTWFGDISMLALLTSIALMAAPTLLRGWRRAAIAAEGQDVVAEVAPPLWPLAVSAIAFLFGFSWRVWMSNRSKQ